MGTVRQLKSCFQICNKPNGPTFHRWSHIMTGSKDLHRPVAIVLLIVSIAACVYGAYRGEVKTVNRKSTNICLECIGIG